MPWLKVGAWVLNTDDISAVHYDEMRDGPRIEVYTRSGGESYRAKGGFRAVGEEARRLWSWCVEHSVDVMTTPTRAVHAAVGAANGRAADGLVPIRYGLSTAAAAVTGGRGA
jgi:hypothetical protein